MRTSMEGTFQVEGTAKGRGPGQERVGRVRTAARGRCGWRASSKGSVVVCVRMGGNGELDLGESGPLEKLCPLY